MVERIDAELIVTSWNFESANGVTTPSVTKRLANVLISWRGDDSGVFVAGKVRFVILSYSTKELARDMQ